MAAERIGILGGAFDPPHRGHVDLARAARLAAGLDRVLFVVAPRPPFKDGVTHASAEERFQMLAATLADAGEPDFEASRIELDRPGVSYTIDTIRELRRQHPEAELYFIVGSDTVAELPRWKDATELAKLVRFIVNMRRGESRDVSAPAGFDMTFIEGDVPEVSSSEMRAALAAGVPTGDMLSSSTEAYLRERGLYKAGGL